MSGRNLFLCQFVFYLINVGKNGSVFLVQCIDGSYYALKVQYNLLEKRLKRFQRELNFLKQQESPLFLSYCDNGKIERNGCSYPFVVFEWRCSAARNPGPYHA